LDPGDRLYNLCFFFSSRRRHTRFSRDWSSDVCSSDLGEQLMALQLGGKVEPSTEREYGPAQVTVGENCGIFSAFKNGEETGVWIDRKSTRLNSSHVKISYAVFCLKKKKKKI